MGIKIIVVRPHIQLMNHRCPITDDFADQIPQQRLDPGYVQHLRFFVCGNRFLQCHLALQAAIFRHDIRNLNILKQRVPYIDRSQSGFLDVGDHRLRKGCVGRDQQTPIGAAHIFGGNHSLLQKTNRNSLHIVTLPCSSHLLRK